MATKLGTNFNDHSTAVNFLNVHIARPFSSCAGRDFCFTKMPSSTPWKDEKPELLSGGSREPARPSSHGVLHMVDGLMVSSSTPGHGGQRFLSH
jgi:hypothetical protein